MLFSRPQPQRMLFGQGRVVPNICYFLFPNYEARDGVITLQEIQSQGFKKKESPRDVTFKQGVENI